MTIAPPVAVVDTVLCLHGRFWWCLSHLTCQLFLKDALVVLDNGREAHVSEDRDDPIRNDGRIL